MTVRAKMKCHSIETVDFGGSEKNRQVKVRMGAVYGSDPNHENRAFADATPSGSVELTIQGDKPAAKMFTAGKEYYVDFIEAPAA